MDDAENTAAPPISENEIQLMRLESEREQRDMAAYHKQIDVALEILKMQDNAIAEGEQWKSGPGDKLTRAAELVILGFLQSAPTPGDVE